MNREGEKKVITTRKGFERVMVICYMPMDLYKAVDGLIKRFFMSDSEFMRFCVINTLIHLSESELTKKIEKSGIKRFIQINDKEVEIDGILYSIIKKGGISIEN